MAEGRILIVDDEEIIRELLADTFRDTNYTIELATCGYDAGVLAERIHPDVILLDILLPDVDGREICKQIRRNPVTADAKIIAVTALKEPAQIEEIKAAGADDHIGKPFDVDEIRDKVSAMIANRR